MLLAFSGKKQTGKDICADIIAAISPRLTFQRLNFADPVYEEVARAIWPTTGFNRDLTVHKIAYMKANKDNFRLILQGWGTDYRRKLCSDTYWIDQYKLRLVKIPDTVVVTTTDVRFINEAECIKSLGGILFRVRRETSSGDKHISETELDNYQFDHYIDNNGTIDELTQQLKQKMKSI